MGFARIHVARVVVVGVARGVWRGVVPLFRLDRDVCFLKMRMLTNLINRHVTYAAMWRRPFPLAVLVLAVRGGVI